MPIPVNLNGLFHWKKHRSLILHEVAKAAGLESCGKKHHGELGVSRGDSLFLCLLGPLEDWRGETIYLKVQGVNYIATLPRNQHPVGWYGQFPQLATAREEQAEEHGQIYLMIAQDNWRWMPVHQACRPGRQSGFR
jgi:hypothetical protein